MPDAKPKIEIVAIDALGNPIAAISFYKQYWDEGRLDVVNRSYFRLFQELHVLGKFDNVFNFETRGL